MRMFGRSTFNEPHTITDLKPHIAQTWPLANHVPTVIGTGINLTAPRRAYQARSRAND
jgi:hypothetical protein